MEEKYKTSVDPLSNAMLDMIEQVGKENNFDYVFTQQVTVGALVVLYSKEKSNDLTDLILQKLIESDNAGE